MRFSKVAIGVPFAPGCASARAATTGLASAPNPLPMLRWVPSVPRSYESPADMILPMRSMLTFLLSASASA